MDFFGLKTFPVPIFTQNVDFLKFYNDLSPISKMGACHTIQDGGINVGRVYWSLHISKWWLTSLKYIANIRTLTPENDVWMVNKSGVPRHQFGWNTASIS